MDNWTYEDETLGTFTVKDDEPDWTGITREDMEAVLLETGAWSKSDFEVMDLKAVVWQLMEDRYRDEQATIACIAREKAKTHEELLAKYEELRERVWYQRHLRNGYDATVAAEVRAKYANRTLYGRPMLEWDEENYQLLEGWMAAIMWASSGMDDDEAVLYDT